MMSRDDVVYAIASLRKDWEIATAGESLLQARSSVGLLLADVATAIGLSPEEQQIAFGAELINELQAVLAPGD